MAALMTSMHDVSEATVLARTQLPVGARSTYTTSTWIRPEVCSVRAKRNNGGHQ